MNNSKDNFSQKTIGILINTRYGKLIHAYYMFFKNLQKLYKSTNNIISGQFMNTSFHTINYYHKILIQFIYLSYIKNDLIKIGESILDYIEFLIKFKFKTSLNDKYFLKIKNKDRKEYKTKLNFKKKIFNKIINWFNLFDDYISYVKDNSTLSDIKSILEDYSNFNSESNEYVFETQSSFMFRINIQRCDFLKGKFSLACKNYNDALFYFIRAAKKKSLVIDGLIKKKSLKHIYKITSIIKEKIEQFKLKNLNMEKEMKEFQKIKNNILYNKKLSIGKKYSNRYLKCKEINTETFGEKIEKIKYNILKNIKEFEIKENKDILILIDFNLYNNNEDNVYAKNYKLDVFIDETISIVNNYLCSYDRCSVFIYTNEYYIICPLMYVNKIDINSFSKDLINYENITFKEKNETEDYDINLNDLSDKDIEYNFGENNTNEYSQEESLYLSQKEEKNYNKINGLIKTINFINNYSKKKGEEKKEKYIILFTDMLNMEYFDEEQIEKILDNLNKDKDVIFLLVGKNEKLDLKKDNHNNIHFNNYKKIENIILSKYGEKSDIINFENMKKIKTILSSNTIIRDEIIYRNEIYK